MSFHKHNRYINFETKGLINKEMLIKEYVIKKRTSTSIAKDLKCEHQTICNYLRKYNIKVRPQYKYKIGHKHGKRTKIHKINLSKSITNKYKNYHIKWTNFYYKQWENISDIDWSWLAGFWEGEGSLFLRKNKYKNTVPGDVMIAQKEKAVLLKIKRLLKTGTIYKEYRDSTYCHRYHLITMDASKVFLEKIFPYMKSPRRIKKIKKYLQDNDILKN